MYLTALITKWRGKGIHWMLDDKGPGKIEITACDMSRKRYISVISENLDEGCKWIDQSLSEYMGNKLDNNHTNS